MIKDTSSQYKIELQNVYKVNKQIRKLFTSYYSQKSV